MQYGLDNFLIHPFLSLILSCLLLTGSFYIGNSIIRYFKLEIIFKNIINLAFLKLLIALYFMG